jgi:hypothetical protein
MATVVVAQVDVGELINCGREGSCFFLLFEGSAGTFS